MINCTMLIPPKNSKVVSFESFNRIMVLFSTSDTNAMLAVNISIIKETISIPGTIMSKSVIVAEVPNAVSFTSIILLFWVAYNV